VTIPASRPSAALTCQGLKWVSKNARTAFRSVATTAFALAHGGSQTARVAGAATRAAHPARKAGQTSATASSLQPGSALHGTGEYFAGNEGAAVGAGGGAATTPGGFALPVAGTVARGGVAQPARITMRATEAVASAADERRERHKMVWFFLEALVALVIAVAFVTWTMGPKRRKPPSDRDRD
jgi:hypothetical protein